MENFVVSARKYRPATFNFVVGQSHISNTLKNAIKTNHLAQAFLFCGPRGVGKTTCARILAKTINCTNLTEDIEPCNQCTSCESFNQGASMNIYELDAASNNSVDDIRSLVEQVRFPPQHGRKKVYIIDEVHMLSNAAFNAFLKTLEEPPSYAIFILATTEKHKIIPTILSRCQIFDFNRIRIEDITDHLAHIAGKETISADRNALHLIAQKADGGLRDALSMFDMVVTFSSDRTISYAETVRNLHVLDYDYYFKIVDALLKREIAQSLLLLNEIISKGFDLQNFIVGFANHLRDLLVCKDSKTVALLEVSEQIAAQYKSQATQVQTPFLVTALNLANQAEMQLKSSKNPRLQIELALIKIGHIPDTFSLLEVLNEKKNDLSQQKTSSQDTKGQQTKEDSPIVRKKFGLDTPEQLAKARAEQQALEAQKAQEKQQVEQLKQQSTRKNTFEIEDLDQALQQFVKQKISTIAAVMQPIVKDQVLQKKYVYHASEQKVTFHYPNSGLQSFLAPVKGLMQLFLQEKLANDLLQVDWSLAIQNNAQENLSSRDQRLKYLGQQNALVAQLIEKLGLSPQ